MEGKVRVQSCSWCKEDSFDTSVPKHGHIQSVTVVKSIHDLGVSECREIAASFWAKNNPVLGATFTDAVDKRGEAVAVHVECGECTSGASNGPA